MWRYYHSPHITCCWHLPWTIPAYGVQIAPSESFTPCRCYKCWTSVQGRNLSPSIELGKRRLHGNFRSRFFSLVQYYSNDPYSVAFCIRGYFHLVQHKIKLIVRCKIGPVPNQEKVLKSRSRSEHVKGVIYLVIRSAIESLLFLVCRYHCVTKFNIKVGKSICFRVR